MGENYLEYKRLENFTRNLGEMCEIAVCNGHSTKEVLEEFSKSKLAGYLESKDDWYLTMSGIQLFSELYHDTLDYESSDFEIYKSREYRVGELFGKESKDDWYLTMSGIQLFSELYHDTLDYESSDFEIYKSREYRVGELFGKLQLYTGKSYKHILKCISYRKLLLIAGEVNLSYDVIRSVAEELIYNKDNYPYFRVLVNEKNHKNIEIDEVALLV